MKTENTIEIPYILTANTYFWNPASNSKQRRNNEIRRNTEAKGYFESWGFKYNKNTNKFELKNASNFIEIDFSYTETCNNVYKSLVIYKNGKKSNITTLKNLKSKGEIRIIKIKAILKLNK